MSSLSSLYIKRETLKTLLDVVSKKDMKGVELTISINEGANDYGQNLSAYVSQSKEDRESSKPKFYAGNGKVFWTDGKIEVAAKQQEQLEEEETEDDLPF